MVFTFSSRLLISRQYVSKDDAVKLLPHLFLPAVTRWVQDVRTSPEPPADQTSEDSCFSSLAAH